MLDCKLPVKARGERSSKGWTQNIHHKTLLQISIKFRHNIKTDHVLLRKIQQTHNLLIIRTRKVQ